MAICQVLYFDLILCYDYISKVHRTEDLMAKQNKETLHAKGIEISIFSEDFQNDFISLTDIARYKSEEPKDVVKNWLRTKDTLEFLGLWEQLHNPNFKGVEFDAFRKGAGLNAFTLSPQKWISSTNAIGMISKSGRYGGTYAHSDIAFEFASWVSAEFKLYIIKDYQRIKSDASSKLALGWNLNREIAKLNYKIHTDAIKENLIPQKLAPKQKSMTYANEADVLNVALFGKTAKEWRDEYPKSKGNIRDYASLQQLLVLANLESYNAILIKENIPQEQRLDLLNKMAIDQLKAIQTINIDSIQKLSKQS